MAEGAATALLTAAEVAMAETVALSSVTAEGVEMADPLIRQTIPVGPAASAETAVISLETEAEEEMAARRMWKAALAALVLLEAAAGYCSAMEAEGATAVVLTPRVALVG
jgi:hypothetical protein